MGGPKPCQEGKGPIHCSGDQIDGSQTAFVEEWCVEGEIFFINKITGLTFPKGRLSGAVKTLQTTTKKNVKARSTTIPTTTTTTITIPTTTKTTTTRPTTTVSPSKTTSITTSASTTRSVEEERPVDVVEDDEFSLEYVNTVLEDK